jgi:hypothetical protein
MGLILDEPNTMFFIQASTLPPTMHPNLLSMEGALCKKPTKVHGELEDTFNGLFTKNRLLLIV